jgi:hypothetical protein
MRRRRFINLFTSFTSSLLIIPQNVFSKISQQISSSGDRFRFSGRVQLKSKSLRVDESLPLAIKWSHDYMSLEDFAEAFHFGLYTNDQKRKSVLYLEKDRITFTADNTFVKFNDQMLQIPIECLWYDESVWVPVKYFTNILNKFTPFQFVYDQKSKEFALEETDVNITGVRIAAKENGTLIDVFTTKRFKEKEITLDIRNRWLHIDVYGAKVDPASLGTVQPSGIISEIKAFQMAETASLSFKLKKEVLSRELVFSQTGNDFHVNLRTKQIIAENEEHEKIKHELEEQKKRWMIDRKIPEQSGIVKSKTKI